MEESAKESLAKPLIDTSNLPKMLVLALVVSLLAGVASGFYFVKNGNNSNKIASTLGQPPKAASQDTQTFRDFAEGTIKPKSSTSHYTEGTHLLERDNAVPVALTSSVVDLSLYEGKKVKVYGETQKALSEGWLMDVGKVEELK